MGASTSRKKKMVPAVVTIRTVDGSILQGRINLGAERRVSDVFIRSSEPFIVLSDATYTGGSGKVLVINKNHIVWIEPEDLDG